MPATLVGLLVALVAVMMGAQTHHVSPVFLVSNVTALLIVLGGALGATMASFELSATTGVFKAIMKAVLGKDTPIDSGETIKTLVEFARKARGEGLLALESEMAGLDDPFMKRGLQLAIDGSDPDSVAQVMRTDIKAMKVRHKVSMDWCQSYGIFAPTFGIIGAVIGLVATLGELDKPEKLGVGIAGAFVATFLGVFMANGVMLPLANRMKRLSAQEVQAREMVMEGVLAIQGGQNPRVIEETLMSYLSPGDAEALRTASRLMSGGKSRGHHRHEEHEEHEEHVNHEAWVIPYADMLTLLMALFLVLFAVGRTDIEKFKKLAESFRQEFGNGGSAEIVSVGTGSTGDTPIEGGNGVLDNVEIRPSTAQIEEAIEVAEETAAEAAVGELSNVRDEIQALADEQGVGDKIAFRFEGRGLIVTILDDSVLFEPGQATLQPPGVTLLDLVTGSLQALPNDIAIEGHTDSRPISTSRYPSNWELSTSRATSVLRYMLLQGFDPSRISAAGYADTRPVADNATPEGQSANRRVEIVIVSDIPLDAAVEIDG